jgi:hypothetical protein
LKLAEPKLGFESLVLAQGKNARKWQLLLNQNNFLGRYFVAGG